MKKTVNFLIRSLAIFALTLAVFAPEAIGAPGLILGGTFITTSFTWAGKENLDYFLKPMFIGLSPWETQGVRVIPNVQSKLKLNYFGAASKLLKAYAKGFNAASGVAYTQRDLEVHRMKAEAAEDANDFYQTVFEQGLRKDDWNNLDGTQLKQIIIEIYSNAVKSDVFRQFWLNNTAKETVSGGFFTGTPDADYNVYKGIFQLLMENASATPTADQIYRRVVADGAVAQVQTVTMSVDAAGTGNLLINGKNYLVTRDTDATTTFTNFKTLYSAELLTRGLALSGTSTLIVTSTVPGRPVAAITWTGLTGTVAFTIAATTANTAPAALAAGESEDIFQDLLTKCDKVLKGVPANQKVLLVSDLVLENYIAYLEGLGSERAHQLIENGKEFWTYRGVKILNPGWDVHLAADWPAAAGTLHEYPHRVIYTTVDNLVLGLDALSGYNETKMWYNEDQEENRFRSKLIAGAQYVHNKLVAVAY